VTDKPAILVVDSNRANLELISQELGRGGYTILSTASLEELDQAIEGKERFALSLIDLSGFDERIWERCEELNKAKIPFILISPQRSPSIQREYEAWRQWSSDQTTQHQGFARAYTHIAW